MFYLSSAFFFLALALYFRRNPGIRLRPRKIDFNAEMTLPRLLLIGLIPGLPFTILTGSPVWMVVFALLPYFGYHHLKRTKEKERVRTLRKSMLAAIHLLWIPCNAGLGFRDAVKKIAAETDNPVIKEIDRCSGEISAGKRKEVSYKELVRRTIPELEPLMRAVSHTEGMGSPLSGFLKKESERLQAERRAKIQELGDRISNKTLYIVIGVMGPGFVFLLFGPVVSRFQVLTNLF